MSNCSSELRITPQRVKSEATSYQKILSRHTFDNFQLKYIKTPTIDKKITDHAVDNMGKGLEFMHYKNDIKWLTNLQKYV